MYIPDGTRKEPLHVTHIFIYFPPFLFIENFYSTSSGIKPCR